MTSSANNEELRYATPSTAEEEEALERDIRELQDKIGAALDYYLELKQKYGELGGWDMVEDKLTLSIGWAELPLETDHEEEEEC